MSMSLLYPNLHTATKSSQDFDDPSEKEFKNIVKMLIHIEKIDANDIKLFSDSFW